MRRANIVSGIMLALFGLVMLFAVIPWQIETAPPGFVSPRLVPNITMVVVVVLALLLVIANWRAPVNGDDAENASPIARVELMALLRIGAIFALSIALFRWVSPLAAGASLMVVTLLTLGERRPLPLIAIPAAILLATWFLFYKVIGTEIL